MTFVTHFAVTRGGSSTWIIFFVLGQIYFLRRSTAEPAPAEAGEAISIPRVGDCFASLAMTFFKLETPSIVTNKAIVRGVVLPMALDAEAHFEILEKNDAIHPFNVAVAVAAIDPGRQVHAVIEMGQIREI